MQRYLLQGLSLEQAIEDTSNKIRRQPAAIGERWRLFQLQCVNGDWISAIKQLQVWASLSTDHLKTAQRMRELLRAESYRVDVMKGNKQPGWLNPPMPWSALLARANGALSVGDAERADKLRAQALANAPHTPGHANPGEAFARITDGDTRVGAHCELYLPTGYRWVPFTQIAQLRFFPVREALDLVWRRCTVTLSDQVDLNAYMPTRYPVVRKDDNATKLAVVTAWTDRGKTTVAGSGQRTWMTDTGQIAMLDVSNIHLQGYTGQ